MVRERSSEPTPKFDPAALHRLRKNVCRLSLDELGRRSRTTRAQLIGYESGAVRPGLATLAALAAALDVAPVELTTIDPNAPTLHELRAVVVGITRTAMAQRTGLARSTWDAIERGRRRLPPTPARRAARALQVSVEELMAARERGIRPATRA